MKHGIPNKVFMNIQDLHERLCAQKRKWSPAPDALIGPLTPRPVELIHR